MVKGIKFLLFTAVLVAASVVSADVEIKSDVKEWSAMGKTKLFKSAPMEIYVAQFDVLYFTSKANLSKEIIQGRSEFDIGEKLALQVTDAAYAYLVKQLEAKGFAVKVHSAEDINETKLFKKFLKKGGATVVSGKTYVYKDEKNKQFERILTQATGVNMGSLGEKASGGDYVMLPFQLGGDDGRLSVNVNTRMDYVEEKLESREGPINIKETLNFVPGLRLYDQYSVDEVKALGAPPQSSFNFYNSGKMGLKVFGHQEYVSTLTNWVTINREDDENDYSTWKFSVKEAEYKKAAGELLEKYVDQLVDQIVMAKEKGK